MCTKSNPFAATDVGIEPRRRNSKRLISVAVIVIGAIIGIVGLVLVSNRFGNTDTMGLPVVTIGSFLLSTGVSSLFMKWRYSFVVGVLLAPLSVGMLFVLVWGESWLPPPPQTVEPHKGRSTSATRSTVA